MAEDDRTTAGLARVRGRTGKPVGAGFLAAVSSDPANSGRGGYVLTCAHVVNAALGRPLLEAEAPPAEEPVQLDLWA